jgi:hypothetical protein
MKTGLAAEDRHLETTLSPEQDAAAGGEARSVLEGMLQGCASPRSAQFASGRSVTMEDGAPERLVVRSPSGLVELSIRFTPGGPVLSFASAALDLEASGALRIACAKLEVTAREGIEVKAGGSVKAEVEGDHLLAVSGASRVEADSIAMRARLGDVAIKANDDVRVDGERIFLNG